MKRNIPKRLSKIFSLHNIWHKKDESNWITIALKIRASQHNLQTQFLMLEKIPI